MKKIVFGLLMLCLVFANVLLPVKGNSFTDASDIIKYELDTYETINDLSVDAINIYSFQVEEKGAYCFEADYTFKDKDDKVMSIAVINMNTSKDLLDIPIAELSDEQVHELVLNMLNSVQYNIDDETDALTYHLEKSYYLEPGTYWMTVVATGGMDEETWEIKDVDGNAVFKVSPLEKDAYSLTKVKFSYKDSLYLDVQNKTTVVTYITGGDIPRTIYNTEYKAPMRDYYEFMGYYAYRKRDGKWLYAEEYIDDSLGFEMVEYRNYSWYKKGKEPEGYVRYPLYFESYGSEVYAMDTMQDGDVIIHREEWQGYPYVIRYHANQTGKGTMKNSYYNYGKTKKLRKNTFTSSKGKLAGWKARRASDNKWLYTNGTTTKWYKEGKQPKGWKKYVFKDQEATKNLTKEYDDVIHMYATYN